MYLLNLFWEFPYNLSSSSFRTTGHTQSQIMPADIKDDKKNFKINLKIPLKLLKMLKSISKWLLVSFFFFQNCVKHCYILVLKSQLLWRQHTNIRDVRPSLAPVPNICTYNYLSIHIQVLSKDLSRHKYFSWRDLQGPASSTLLGRGLVHNVQGSIYDPNSSNPFCVGEISYFSAKDATGLLGLVTFVSGILKL